MTRIVEQSHIIKKEPLLSPFGFKGKYLTELWQSIAILKGKSGATGMGQGVQSILWSDDSVFLKYGEEQGNIRMAEVTRFALQQVEDSAFEHPIEWIKAIVPDVYEYAKRVTDTANLRLTFALNALVGLDQAAWAVYGKERGEQQFHKLIPEAYHAALSWQHTALASIPIVSYGMTEGDVQDLLEEGYFLLKIKIGADPDQDGDQEKMLAWDCGRLSLVHRLASEYETDYTENGKIAYYLDANGRYANKDILLRFVEYADSIGALERILLFEEPFAEHNHIDVTDVPVRLAADESVHNEQDALERIQMGFRAIALKPVAKTMSISLNIAKLAHERGIPCFCADLTANPLLADWNKNLAARLAPLPGLTIGAIETNGHQNYKNWEQMARRHPRPGAIWTRTDRGIYPLDETFYACSGGALEGSIDRL